MPLARHRQIEGVDLLTEARKHDGDDEQSVGVAWRDLAGAPGQQCLLGRLECTVEPFDPSPRMRRPGRRARYTTTGFTAASPRCMSPPIVWTIFRVEATS